MAILMRNRQPVSVLKNLLNRPKAGSLATQPPYSNLLVTGVNFSI